MCFKTIKLYNCETWRYPVEDFEELKRRLVERGTEDEETINLRMNNAKKEVEFLNEYNYSIVNDFIDESVDKMKAIIEAERLKIKK